MSAICSFQGIITLSILNWCFGCMEVRFDIIDHVGCMR